MAAIVGKQKKLLKKMQAIAGPTVILKLACIQFQLISSTR